MIGSQIGFTITVHNGGQGTAFGVSVSDTLDSRFTWSIESQSGDLTWQLAGNVLTALRRPRPRRRCRPCRRQH